MARLGERALKNGDPEALMRDAVTLIGELDGVEFACIWEVGRDGRRLNLRAGLDDTALASGRRVSAGRESHAGAALDAGVPVIVGDWSEDERFAMPPAVRALGATSSLAVIIDGKDRPFGVLDVHSGEPRRFGPKDVPFLEASANVLADAFERHAADRALRHRVLHDALTGLPNRLSFVDSLDDALGRAAMSGLAGRRPLPRPRPLQAHQRQPRPPRRRRPAARGRAAAARPPAPRRHRRPLRRRRVRDPDRPARRRRRGGRDRRAGRRRLRPALLDAGRRPLRQRLDRDRRRPPRDRPATNAELLIRDADAAMYRAKERGRARSELFDAEMRATRGAPPGDRARAAPRDRPRRAGAALPADRRPAQRRGRPASRRWSAGTTPSAACSTPPSSSRSPRTAA